MAEVVPVSSSAQLVLLPWLLGWEQPADRTSVAAGLHAGSCLGISWALRRDLLALDRRTALVLAGASLPAAVAGYAGADLVEKRLGRPPQLASLLAAVGALMWWVDARSARSPSGMITSDPPGEPQATRSLGGPGSGVTGRQAALAGLAQVVALAPGVSRSGATLTALRALGVDRVSAQRFSLLMSLPVTAGAAVLTLRRADPAVVRAVAPGAVAAAFAGAVTATRQARRPGRPLRAPALYRLGLAAWVASRLVRKGAQ